MKEQLEKICKVEEYDGVFLPIDQSWKNIAINVSGGADSALLAYLICSRLTGTNVHIINNVRMWKTRPWQKYDNIKVFNWLKEHFPKHNFTRHENLIAPEIEYGNIGASIALPSGEKKSGDQISSVSFSEYVCHYNNVEAWFAGVTANPSEESITLKLPERNLVFSGTKEDINKIIFKRNNVLVCHPFLFTSKDWVIKNYIRLELLDLFALTRSCEGDRDSYPGVFQDLDYRTYVPFSDVPECGKCFWCQERNWAKKQNNLK